MTGRGRPRLKSREKGSYDNSNREVNARIRRAQKELIKEQREEADFAEENKLECTGYINGVAQYAGTESGKRLEFKHLARRRIIEQVSMTRNCPSCEKFTPNSRAWVVDDKLGTMCRSCFTKLPRLLTRRKLWRDRLLEAEFRKDTYALSALVGRFSASGVYQILNPLGIACQVAEQTNERYKPPCQIMEGYVVSRGARYVLGPVPEDVRTFFQLKTAWGGFVSATPIADRPYQNMVEMCNDGQPYELFAEVMKLPSMWAIRTHEDYNWWD